MQDISTEGKKIFGPSWKLILIQVGNYLKNRSKSVVLSGSENNILPKSENKILPKSESNILPKSENNILPKSENFLMLRNEKKMNHGRGVT